MGQKDCWHGETVAFLLKRKEILVRFYTGLDYWKFNHPKLGNITWNVDYYAFSGSLKILILF